MLWPKLGLNDLSCVKMILERCVVNMKQVKKEQVMKMRHLAGEK